MALDGEPTDSDEDVEHVSEGAVYSPDRNALNDTTTEHAEYLGCFALELTDRATALNALNRIGCCFLTSGLGIGLRVLPACDPCSFHRFATVILSDHDISARDDAFARLVGAISGAERDAVPCTLGLGRDDSDRLSTSAALALMATIKFCGAKLVRADARARSLPPKLQARRISIVPHGTNGTLTLDLIVQPQNVSSSGFMGKTWDGSKVGFSVDVWREIFRVLKPGAPLLAFGGSRTYHRLACAIEDAGFELRDQLLWLYGKGFPKSQNIGLAIDKSAGATREVVGTRTLTGNGEISSKEMGVTFGVQVGSIPAKEVIVTEPARELAQKWDGYGTALKPAWESVAFARKPLELRGLVATLAQKLAEAICLLPSYVNSAVESSASSQAARDVVRPDSALWDAVRRCSTLDDLCDLMGTLRSESEIPSSLSIGWSWLCILAEASELGSTFTIATDSSLITDLRTLNYSASSITPYTIIQAAMKARGIIQRASLVSALFDGVASRLAIIRMCSAGDVVTSRGADEVLRPDFEPVVLARRPLEGTMAANVARWGVGGLAIDACRIGEQKRVPGSLPKGRGSEFAWSKPPPSMDDSGQDPNVGRWPANLLLSHTDGCRPTGATRTVNNGTAVKHRGVVAGTGASFGIAKPVGTPDAGYGTQDVDVWDCSPDCPVRLLDEQAGERPSTLTGRADPSKSHAHPSKATSPHLVYGQGMAAAGTTVYADSGGPSRFFFCSKVSTFEREFGCEDLPMRSAGEMTDREDETAGRGGVARNYHPTLKPVSLTKWLATLILPPQRGTPRRLLVPYAGSGSEMIGAMRAGWDEVVGIQRASDDDERGYIQIARARIARWADVPANVEPSENRTEPVAAGQTALWKGGGR